MAHQPYHYLELDPRDPSVLIRHRLWAAETKRDFERLIAASKKAIATSKALLAQFDQLPPPR
jgi:hypothetical protein